MSLRFATEIAAVTGESVVVRGAKGEAAPGYNAVLVMIGSIPPWEALRAVGVRTIAEGG